MNIKDMVKDKKKVRFSYYRDGTCWYVTECGFEFPVPLDDIGNATLLAEDRAMLFMRYIRKHLETLENARGRDNPFAFNPDHGGHVVTECKRLRGG